MRDLNHIAFHFQNHTKISISAHIRRNEIESVFIINEYLVT